MCTFEWLPFIAVWVRNHGFLDWKRWEYYQAELLKIHWYRLTNAGWRVSIVLIHSARYTDASRVPVEQENHSSQLILGKWTQMCRPSFCRARSAHGPLCRSRWTSTRRFASDPRTRRGSPSTQPNRGSRAPSWQSFYPSKRRNDVHWMINSPIPNPLGNKRMMIFYGLSAQHATRS